MFVHLTASQPMLLESRGDLLELMRLALQFDVCHPPFVRLSIDATGLSLMPDGLEQAITPQTMADLIAYLKSGG